MSYYHKCPNCGASLDPQERCDCRDSKATGNKKKEPAPQPSKARR